jgi:hypothetical protein
LKKKKIKTMGYNGRRLGMLKKFNFRRRHRFPNTLSGPIWDIDVLGHLTNTSTAFIIASFI